VCPLLPAPPLPRTSGWFRTRISTSGVARTLLCLIQKTAPATLVILSVFLADLAQVMLSRVYVHLLFGTVSRALSGCISKSTQRVGSR
jgi:hypothetical protein